uniref:Ion transport domain-containing protein n=1 Tax=Eutreptiella gymnastica TaxID=73025 RepID=A0A7S1IC78_9EUGL|mmetsp:Transcript_146081/g.255052  ORF Transcript_146081/g.255052 Transcript_146081/m.255052 type:complete len:875 (+) Transcript_146081:110-2734(+)
MDVEEASGCATWAAVQRLSKQRRQNKRKQMEERMATNKEAQQHREHQTGIWKAIRDDDEEAVKRIVTSSENCPCRKEKGKEIFEIRDSMGATPIHVAFLYRKFDLAKMLVTKYRKFATLTYDSEAFKGENILHIAIMCRNVEICKYLLELHPQLLCNEATGSFFNPQSYNFLESGNYYGGYPLLFAIATNQWDIAEACLAVENVPVKKSAKERANRWTSPELISQCSSIRLCDTEFQNNALHLCVFHNLKEMYDNVLDYVKRQAGPENATKAVYEFAQQTNRDGLTPLALAAAMGKDEMFEHILNRSGRVEWPYGPVMSKLFPIYDIDQHLIVMTADLQEALDKLDQMRASGTIDDTEYKRQRDAAIWKSGGWTYRDKESTKYREREKKRNVLAIECLCAGRSLTMTRCLPPRRISNEVHEGRLKILMLPQIKELLDKKWRVFGKAKFYQKFARFLFFMTLATIGWVIPHHYRLAPEKAFTDHPKETVCIIVCEAITALHCLAILYGEFREIESEGSIKSWWHRSGAAWLDSQTTILFSVLYLASLLCVFTSIEIQSVVAAFAAFFGWFQVLFFLYGFRSTGPFIIMIKEMVSQDMRKFFMVYLTILWGFTLALYLCLSYQTDPGPKAFFQEFHSLLLMSLIGNIDLDKYFESSNPALAQILVLMYVIYVVILLLNLLIAMMSSTYNDIVCTADSEWYAERANIMLSLEKSETIETMQKYRLQYATPLWVNEGQKEDPEPGMQLYMGMIMNIPGWKEKCEQTCKEFAQKVEQAKQNPPGSPPPGESHSLKSRRPPGVSDSAARAAEDEQHPPAQQIMPRNPDPPKRSRSPPAKMADGPGPRSRSLLPVSSLDLGSSLDCWPPAEGLMPAALGRR